MPGSIQELDSIAESFETTKEENLNYKMVANLGSLTSLGLVFGQVCSIEGCFNSENLNDVIASAFMLVM